MMEKKLDKHIFVISGASGVGKNATLDVLFKNGDYENMDLVSPRSYTTRNMRTDDPSDEYNYVFVSEERFDELIDEGDILEMTQSHGHRYGTSLSEFEKCITEGHNIIKVLDKPGARFLKKLYPHDTTTIWIKPPSLKILAERLTHRQSEDPESFSRRMRDSFEEMQDIADYDYVLTNNDLNHTADIMAIIIRNTLIEKEERTGIFSNMSISYGDNENDVFDNVTSDK